MKRIALPAAVVVGTLASTAAAAAATWTTVPQAIPGRPVASAADGPRTLVASVHRREVSLTTIGPQGGSRHERVARMEGRAPPRRVQLVRLPGGAAVLVWQDDDTTRASLRPAAGLPFGSPRPVDPRPDALARGAALAAAGDAAVVTWWGGPSGGELGIYASELAADRQWSPPVEVSAGTFSVPAGPGPPLIELAAGGSPEGSAGAVWRHVITFPDGSWRWRIVAARRDPTGAWSAPVPLRTADRVVAFTLVAAVTRDGVAGAWSESRRLRPDGVASETCLVTGSGGDTQDLDCRSGYDPGTARLVPTRGGGALAAWARGPDPPPPLRSVTLFSRPAGGGWSPGLLAVAESRYGELSGAVPLPRGGALLGIRFGVAPRAGDRARLLVVSDDGRVVRRIPGPRTPLIPRDRDFVLDVVGPRRAILLVSSDTSSRGYRASLMRLSASDLLQPAGTRDA